MTKLTFENVPEYTYWKNPKTGTVLSLGVYRKEWNDYNPNPNRCNLTTENTRYELSYYYTWDEIVEKFEYLGECNDEDFYINFLSNKRLYWNYKYSKLRIPRLRRMMKREPEADRGSELEKMLANVEKYNNLETFELEF